MDRCFICGGAPEVPIFTEDGTFIKYLCGRCLKIPAQCGLCEKAQICPFETDSSPLPKVVMKTIQQGNMMLQTQIKNPERIEITCKTQCPCFSEEFGCLKENGICGDYAEMTPSSLQQEP